MGIKKVLVVDDDREWNLLLKMRLELAGFRSEQAFNGKEAIQKVNEGRPDLILLDITMPEMDGWDVCKALRDRPDTKDLPIIIISSFSQTEDIERGKSFRVKHYIIKPCSPKTVLQNVSAILSPQGS